MALQFPDELLVDSVAIAQEIERTTNVKTFILGDTSYGRLKTTFNLKTNAKCDPVKSRVLLLYCEYKLDFLRAVAVWTRSPPSTSGPTASCTTAAPASARPNGCPSCTSLKEGRWTWRSAPQPLENSTRIRRFTSSLSMTSTTLMPYVRKFTLHFILCIVLLGFSCFSLCQRLVHEF